MRKNYFLSLFLLMTAFWHVQATDGTKSTNPNGNPINTTMFVEPISLNAPTNLAGAAVGGPPAGTIASYWSNGIVVSTIDSLPAPVTGAIVATPYSQRINTLYFSDNSTNETDFIIERSASGGSFAVIATIPGVSGTGQRMYVDSTTQPNTSYVYRVSPSNVAGVGLPEATTSSFTTLPDPPIPPNSLGTFSIGLNSIGLFWINAANNATGFLIQRSVDNNSWVTIGTNPPYTNGFVAQNLDEGQRYFFRIIAFNEGGESVPCAVKDVTTKKRIAPNPAFNLVAKTISTTQINLSWNLGTQDDETNNRVAQEIYRSSVNATEGFIRIAIIGDYEASYSDTTGTPKTTYWYKILTTNYQGQSPYSNAAQATTLGPPYAPTNLATVLANDALGNTIIKATWKDNSDDEWGFSLERSTDSTFATGVLKADLVSNTVVATSIPIEEGVVYYFRVNASNKYGVSKYSETTKLDVIVSAVPNAPYDLKGTATATEVSLKWGDDSNKEAAFDVERSLDGTTFTKIGSTVRNEVTYSDKSVSEKTKYSYRVRATNIKGNSSYTNVLVVTTPAKVSASLDLTAEDVFNVFPNPTADAVKVSVSENMLKDSGMIIITDKSNRIISKTILTPNQSEYNLDLSNYSEGTYTISLRTSTQQITKRVYKF